MTNEWHRIRRHANRRTGEEFVCNAHIGPSCWHCERITPAVARIVDQLSDLYAGASDRAASLQARIDAALTLLDDKEEIDYERMEDRIRAALTEETP